MSKNITISEGLQAKNFSNVSKIRVNNIGGGTSDWIPEEEAGMYANLEELSVSKNGTYNASDEDVDGFSKVIVKVDPNVTTKTITKNGTYRAKKDKVDGYSEVSVQVPTGGGGELITKSISENGTYNASEDGADGYSSVTVNVGGGGGSLITKQITANGTYNASADGADGYSSVTVNVAAPQHGNSIVSGLDDTSVAQRISTRDFFYDFDEKLWFSIQPLLSTLNKTWQTEMEDKIRNHKWLDGDLFSDMLNYNNLVIFASGAQTNTVLYPIRIEFYIFGIADENATIRVSDVTANGCTITISDDTKFYSAGNLGLNSMEWKLSGLTSWGNEQKTLALSAINNQTLWGNSGESNTINLGIKIPTLSGELGTGLMTNLV